MAAKAKPVSWCLDADIREIATRLAPDARRFAGTTILLTGGHGFLGRYYAAVFDQLNRTALAKKPCTVILADNHITSGTLGAGMRARRHQKFLQHDVIQPLALTEPLDYIIHAAGIASPYYYRKYPLETLEVAITGTKNLLQLARRQPNLKGFLFYSSSEIYGDPDAAHVPTAESYRGNVSCLGARACYDESKRVGETLCQIFHERYGVPTKIVRPFNVYGPGMQETDYRVLPNFASRIIGGRPLHIYGNGKQTRTFCYITDAMVGFVKVLIDGTPGQAYNIGNPVPEVSMVDLAKTCASVLRRALRVELVEYPDTYPADEPQRRCPDIRKASVQVKYQPEVALEEGLRRFLRWAQTLYTGQQV